MLDSDKQVFMYLSDKPISPSVHNPEEYDKVLKFKEYYSDKGIYRTYASTADLKKTFLAHLSKFFLSKEALDEFKEERNPHIKLVVIDNNGDITEDTHIVVFELSQILNPKDYSIELEGMFDGIKKFNIENSQVETTYTFPTLNSVKVV